VRKKEEERKKDRNHSWKI